MSLGPAPVLALLLALVHVSLYVLIRGSAGQRLPWLVLAAFLGAWAGDRLLTLGGRLEDRNRTPNGAPATLAVFEIIKNQPGYA